MHNQKKIQKIKQLLSSVLKETVEENFFDEIRIKTKQSLEILNQIEKNIERKNKKIEKAKSNKLLTGNPKLILKMLDDQIEQQQNIIDKLEKKNSNLEDKNIQTLFD